MSKNDFSFWNESSTGKSPKKSSQNAPAKRTSPAFPGKIDAEWIRDQLDEATWTRATRGKGQCSPETIQIMMEFARKTPSKRAICVRSGIHPATWHTWEQRAALGEQPYLLWYQCIALALSELEEELLDNVRGASMNDWKAATWLLGKINKDEFGDTKGAASPQQSISIESKSDKSTKVTINSLTREDTDRIGEIFSQIGAFEPREIESGDVVDGEVVEEEDK